MKKSIFILSVLGAAAAAHAQSSVTLHGTVDTTINRVTGSTASRTQLTSGGNSTSKLSLRGREDLGGGMSAAFWMEAGLNADTGMGKATNTNNQKTSAAGNGSQGLVFDRRASVELHAPWGSVEAGRLWAPIYDTYTGRFDLFAVGVGIGLNYTSSINPSLVRVSNSVAYNTPKFSGVWARLQHWRGENASNVTTADDGTGSGLMLGYGQGPWAARLHYARTDYLTGDSIHRAIAAHYDPGAFRVAFNLNRDELGQLEQRGYNVGGIYRVGVGEIKLGVSGLKTNATAAGPSSRKVAVGYQHNLSKRTALYATYAHISNKNGATLAIAGSTTAANQKSTGFDLGLRHNF